MSKRLLPGSLLAALALLMTCAPSLAQEERYREKTIELKSGTIRAQPTEAPPTGAPRVATAPPTLTDRLILSFERRVTPAEQAALAQKGITIISYLGATDYLARSNMQSSDAILELSKSINRITHVADYGRVEQKYDPTIKQPIVPPAEGATPRVAATPRLPISVRLWEDADIEATRQQLAALGTVIAVRPNTRTIDVEVAGAEVIDKISALKSVRYIARKPQPFTQNSNVRRAMGVETVWQTHGVSGKGVKVGIWDGWRVSDVHPAFVARLTFGPLPPGTPIQRFQDHATHVAGTIAGTGVASDPAIASGAVRRVPGSSVNREKESAEAPSADRVARSAAGSAPSPAGAPPAIAALPTGLAPFAGIAPASSLMSFGFYNAVDEFLGALRSQPDLLDVTNNSWGYTDSSIGCTGVASYTQDAHDYDALINGRWENERLRRIPVVFAAGNIRDDLDYLVRCDRVRQRPFPNYRTVLPPGSAKNVITVGAVDADDFSMTSFSGFGPTLDGRVKPDVVAPGCRGVGDAQGIVSAVPDKSLGRMCGTSMAAPAVTGLVALMIEKMQKTGMDPKQVHPSSHKALLIHGADKAGTGPDYTFGYGHVRAPETLALIEAKVLSQGLIETEGGEAVREIQVAAGSSEIKITLAWDDPPAALEASQDRSLLVNDLDLVLVSPSGQTFLPWVLHAERGREREPAVRGVDTRNVVEQASVAQPAAGTWRILVRGTRLGLGPQSYSLVATAR